MLRYYFSFKLFKEHLILNPNYPPQADVLVRLGETPCSDFNLL
jgi:hypothetical protein